MDRRYRASFPASLAAMNSASVELWEMVDWKRERYTTGAPAKYKHIPEMDLRCLVSPAQSESTNPIAESVVGLGRSTLWLSVRMVGIGMEGSC